MGLFKFFFSVLGVSLVGVSKFSIPFSDSESDLSFGATVPPSPKLGRPLGNISSISESESSEYSDSLRDLDLVFGGALTSKTISISESESSKFSTGDFDFSRSSVDSFSGDFSSPSFESEFSRFSGDFSGFSELSGLSTLHRSDMMNFLMKFSFKLPISYRKLFSA